MTENILEAANRAAAARPQAGSWGRAGLKSPPLDAAQGPLSPVPCVTVTPSHSGVCVWSSLDCSFQHTNAVCDAGSCGYSALLPMAQCSKFFLTCRGIACIANIRSLDLTTWRCFPSCGIVFPFPDIFPAPCTFNLLGCDTFSGLAFFFFAVLNCSGPVLEIKLSLYVMQIR